MTESLSAPGLAINCTSLLEELLKGNDVHDLVFDRLRTIKHTVGSLFNDLDNTGKFPVETNQANELKTVLPCSCCMPSVGTEASFSMNCMCMTLHVHCMRTFWYLSGVYAILAGFGR